jgi:CDP-glucose 4,6-dehydratase
VRALKSGNPIIVRNPSAIRPWQHVLEPLSGYLRLASALASSPTSYSGAWNFGPNEGNVVPVSQLVAEVFRVWGAGSWEMARDSGPDVPHEARALTLSCEKARRHLQWTPRWNLNQTVRATVAWYKDASRADTALCRTLCVDQIDEYMSLGEMLEGANER